MLSRGSDHKYSPLSWHLQGSFRYFTVPWDVCCLRLRFLGRSLIQQHYDSKDDTQQCISSKNTSNLGKCWPKDGHFMPEAQKGRVHIWAQKHSLFSAIANVLSGQYPPSLGSWPPSQFSQVWERVPFQSSFSPLCKPRIGSFTFTKSFEYIPGVELIYNNIWKQLETTLEGAHGIELHAFGLLN